MNSAPFVLLDNAQPGSERLRVFAEPIGIILAENADDVPGALAAIGDVQERGLYAAGYLSYELGYALESRLLPLLPGHRAEPLLWFGIFERQEEIGGSQSGVWLESRRDGRAYCGPLRLEETRESYAEKFVRVRRYLDEGDLYQLNLTFPGTFGFAGDPLALYLRLRARSEAAHGAFLFDGTRHVLSLSPELFFSVSNSVLTARPMKGTSPRGADQTEDAKLAAELAASEKDRTENLIIVDLIRNDLSRVAKKGGVRVEDLFAIETYPTVHQMVSTVRADLRTDVSPEELIRALFPCGSVTGTPKIRAQEVIHELEHSPRGIYCGAVGVFAPDGSADFNVAIRTITLTGNAGRLGVGGAIVADSLEDEEYEECLVKARYYTGEREPVGLIETLRHEPGTGFIRGDVHLSRLERSAAVFSIPFSRDEAERALTDAVRHRTSPSRIRMVLSEDGTLEVKCEPFPKTSEAGWTYAISPRRVQSTDPLARHKTTWRALIDSEFGRLNRATACDQVVFLNERGELAEASGSNIFVRKNGRLVTPPLSAGALDGCLRRALLESGECEEGVLTPADLEDHEVFLGNSLRGLVRAVRAVNAQQQGAGLD
jgi:para-aminobenzoate synthetase/4-amino-4-deoxychorismate lyase